MAILFCGGEFEDFDVLGGSPAYDPTHYRNGYARICMGTVGPNYIYKDFANDLVPIPPITNASDPIWFSFRGALGYYQTGGVLLFVFTEGGHASTNERFGMTFQVVGSGIGALAYPQLTVTDGAGNNVVLATSTLPIQFKDSYNNPHKFDLYIAGYDAGKSVKLWVDDVLHVDTTLAGLTGAQLDGLKLKSNGVDSSYYSEVIFAEEDTRRMSLVTFTPNAAGDVNEMTGTYADINEITPNDATIVTTPSVNKRFLAKHGATPTGNLYVWTLKVIGRVSYDDLGPVFFKFGYKGGVGGAAPTVENWGTAQTATGAWLPYREMFPFNVANPAPNSPFTQEEVDLAQFGFMTDAPA